MNDLINNIKAITDNQIIRALIVVLFALIAHVVTKFIISVIFNNRLGKLSKITPTHNYQRRRLKTIGSLVKAFCLFTIWFIAVILIMQIFNVPLAPLLTSAGLIGAALAFGTQSLIKDFISGIFIIFENQYRVDDYIELDKVSGRVEKISMRTTAIRDDNGSLHHVPNGSIVTTTNLSMGRLHEYHQIDVSRSYGFTRLKNKVNLISNEIAESQDYSTVVKEGPVIKSLESVNKDKMTVSLAYVTTAAKRKQALTVVNKLILKEKIPLA